MEVAEKFGGWAFAFALLVERFMPVLPAIVNRLVPQLQAKQHAEEERRNKELDAKIALEKNEQEFRHETDSRVATAVELLTETNQSIKEALISISDRLNGLEYAHKDIPHFHKPKRKKAPRQ